MVYPVWVGRHGDRNFELYLGRHYPDGRGHLQVARFASEVDATSAQALCNGLEARDKYEARMLMRERLRAAGL